MPRSNPPPGRPVKVELIAANERRGGVEDARREEEVFRNSLPPSFYYAEVGLTRQIGQLLSSGQSRLGTLLMSVG
jgi:hypothetical protein